MRFIFLATLLVTAAEVPEVPAAQSAFVHLFEWSWADIAKECEDWLGPKGFRAVQVSPPWEHSQGPSWYERYQPVTYNLTSRSGSEEALRDMVQRCKKVGVDIYVDVVINHVAGGGGVGIAGSPYGYRTTAIFAKEDFHHNPDDLNSNCGIQNWEDRWQVQYCDLVGLPDLCSSCPRVQQLISSALSALLDLGVKGFRIDAAKHIEAGEFKQILEKVKGGIPWLFQEIVEGGEKAVTPEMYEGFGKITEFRYGPSVVSNVLPHGQLRTLETLGESWGFLKTDTAVVFLDNHDTQRSSPQLTFKNGALYTLANIFMLAHPYGYPKVMSSYNFETGDQGPPDVPVHGTSGLACFNGPWVCEHRYTEIANMVAWRHAAGSSSEIQNWQNFEGGSGVFFCRSSSACVALNRWEKSWEVVVHTSLPPGMYHDVMRDNNISACPLVHVRSDGWADLHIPPMSAVAFHINAMVPQNPAPPLVPQKPAHSGVHGKTKILEIIGISALALLVALLLLLPFRAWKNKRTARVRVSTPAATEGVELTMHNSREEQP